MKAFSIGAAVLAVIVLFFFIFTFGWVDIQPTDVGVQIDKLEGKVLPEPLGVGYQFYNRWRTDIVVYHVAARAFPSDTMASENAKEYNLDLKTNDGQNINVDLTIIYALIGKQVPQLHQQVGQHYEDQILLPEIRSEARIIVGSYSAEEIYQGKVRENIQKDITTRLKDTLTPYPAIQIQDALLRHFAFSPEFEKAIEQKKLAAQQVEINKNLALAQQQVALKQEAEAKGLRLQVVQKAEGDANSVKINADAARYRLEQEAAGNLAMYKAQAEGKRLLTEAVGGGTNLVALTFAQNIPDKLQIWGIPVGTSSTSLMDVSGIFGNMFPKPQPQVAK